MVYPHTIEVEIENLNPDGSSKVSHSYRNENLGYSFLELFGNERLKRKSFYNKRQRALYFLEETRNLGIHVNDEFKDVETKAKLLDEYTSLKNLYVGSEKDSLGRTIKTIRKSLEACAKDPESSRVGKVFKEKVKLADDILRGKRLNNKF